MSIKFLIYSVNGMTYIITNMSYRLQFFDAKVKSDVNQIAAVKHIVAGTAYPLPYLLVGFPGKLYILSIDVFE